MSETPRSTRDQIIAVFADLAEEDPTVLRDLLLRIAQWQHPQRAWWVAGPWRLLGEDVWRREAVQIGRSGRRIAQVAQRPDGTWGCIVDGTAHGYVRRTAEEGRSDADTWLRAEGWMLS